MLLLQGGNSLGKYKLYFRNYNIPPVLHVIITPGFWRAEGEGTTNHSTDTGRAQNFQVGESGLLYREAQKGP